MEDRTNFDDLFDENVYEAKRMWQYCQNWSRSIEVVYKAKSGKEILTRTYFPYDPHVSKPIQITNHCFISCITETSQ